MAPRKAAAKPKKPTVTSIQKKSKAVLTSKVILKKIDLQDPNLLTVNKSGATKRSLRSKNEISVPAPTKSSRRVPAESTLSKSIEVTVSPPTKSLRSKKAAPKESKNDVTATGLASKVLAVPAKLKETKLSRSKDVPPSTRSLRTIDERSVPAKLKDTNFQKSVVVNKNCVVVLEKCDQKTQNVTTVASKTKNVRTASKLKEISKVVNPENDSDVMMLSGSSENETIPKQVLSKSTGEKSVNSVKTSRSLRNRAEMQVPSKLRGMETTKSKESRNRQISVPAVSNKENFEVRVISLRNRAEMQVPSKLRGMETTKSKESRNRQISVPAVSNKENFEVRVIVSKSIPEKSVTTSRSLRNRAARAEIQVLREAENEKNVKNKQKTVTVEKQIKKNPVVALKRTPTRRLSIDQSVLTDYFMEFEKNFNIPKSPSKKIVSSPKKPVYKDSAVLNSSDSLHSEDETEKEHVFDFLSNSQSNGSENDVATKNLLLDLKKKGKITIKSRRKRKVDTGKPPAPKKRKVPTKKPLMTSTPNKFLPKTSSALQKPIVKPVLTNNEIIIGDNDFHDYEDEVEVVPSPPPIINSIRNQTSDSLFNAIASTSKIMPIPNPVVQMLKGNVPSKHSTPIKRTDMGSFHSNNSFVSPIQHKSIPWRVDTLKVPSTFNFHRSSDLTPSYSSDVLPYDPNAIREQEIPEVVERSATKNNSDMENVNPNVSVAKSPKKTVLVQRTPLRELSIQNVISPKRKQQPVNLRRQTKYFGFDDFDDEDESLMFGNQENVFEHNNTTLKEKLSALKNIPITKPTRIDVRIVHDVFKSPEKPTDIRKAIQDVPAVNKQLDFEELPSAVEDTIVDLFSDPEQPPLNVTKSIVENAKRSYARVPKPRRYNVDYDHNFDEDSEEEDQVQKKPRKKNTGHNQAQKKEFKEFVEEFNSMCEDVETYDLCVESD